MFRLMLSLATCALLISSAAFAADEDPVEKQLTVAKAEFQATADRARAGLLADLRKKEDAAQKSGDLKTVETVQAETSAFTDRGELPKSVSTKPYESKMRLARTRMDEAYGIAIKQYTKDGKVPLAKVIQQELDEFRKNGSLLAAGPTADALKPGSVWVRPSPRLTLTIIERTGESFRGRVEMGDKIEREVKGTIKDGKVTWFAKDARAIKGNAGGDNYGTIASDKTGDRIDFVWRSGNEAGTFTVRPTRTAKPEAN